MAKISALPVELLLQIFSEVPLSSSHFISKRDGLVRLGRVCRLWRSILYSVTARSLWSKFTLDAVYMVGYDIKDLFTLSGSTPLEIVVESRTWRLYHLLEANSARLRTLLIRRASRFDNLCPIFKCALPLLEELALPAPGNWASKDIWSEVDLSSSAPRLTHLHLSSQFALTKIRWPFTQITILELTISSSKAKATRADMIANFPNLVELYDTTLWSYPERGTTPTTVDLLYLKKLKTSMYLLRWLIIRAPKLEEFEAYGDIIWMCRDEDVSLARRLRAPIRTLRITKVDDCGLYCGSSDEEEEMISDKDSDLDSDTGSDRSEDSGEIDNHAKNDYVYTISPMDLLPFEGLRTMYITLKSQRDALRSWFYALRIHEDFGIMPDLETLDIAFQAGVNEYRENILEQVEGAVLKFVESRIGGSLMRLRFTYLYDSKIHLPEGFPQDRVFRRRLEALQERAEGFEFELVKKWERVMEDYDEDEDIHVDEEMRYDDSEEEIDEMEDKASAGTLTFRDLYTYDKEGDYWY